jgi:integrase
MSLLNCLCAAIPARERVITCEEVFELRDLRHTHTTLLPARGLLVEVVPERLGHASATTTEDDAVLPRGLLPKGRSRRAASRVRA